MNKLFLAGVGFAAAFGLAAALPGGFGQAQQTGGAKPEPIVIPLGQPAVPGMPINQPATNLPLTPGYNYLPVSGGQPPQGGSGGTGSSITSLFPQTAVTPARTGSDDVVQEFLRRNFDAPDPNRDIAVGPAAGKYLICVMSYTGPNAPQWAKEMATELRNTYKFPAVYVFTRGPSSARPSKNGFGKKFSVKKS